MRVNTSSNWRVGFVRDCRNNDGMDEKLFGLVVGLAAGAIGYWFTTFWMKPILQYRELRSKIITDLIYYAQVTTAEGLNESMQKLYEQRVLANRRSAAEMAACLLELPFWYPWWLKWWGRTPHKVVGDLIGFSNTTDHDMADRRKSSIRRSLGIKQGED